MPKTARPLGSALIPLLTTYNVTVHSTCQLLSTFHDVYLFILCVFVVPYVYLLYYVCSAVLTLDAG